MANTPAPLVPIEASPEKPVADRRKQSLYFPDEMLKEMAAEAIRLDRSMSWLVQRAWMYGKEEIAKIPSAIPVPTKRPG